MWFLAFFSFCLKAKVTSHINVKASKRWGELIAFDINTLKIFILLYPEAVWMTLDFSAEKRDKFETLWCETFTFIWISRMSWKSKVVLLSRMQFLFSIWFSLVLGCPDCHRMGNDTLKTIRASRFTVLTRFESWCRSHKKQLKAMSLLGISFMYSNVNSPY